MAKKPRNSRNHEPPPQEPARRDLFKVLAVCSALFVTVLLVYAQTSQHEFIVCDDNPYIYGNRHVIEGFSAKAWRSWQDNPVRWCLTTDHAGNWHPLTWFSHVLDGDIYGIHDVPYYGVGHPEPWKGPQAGGHHITSVLLHAAAAIVLFLAMRRMTGALWCSALVAAMFALHPLRAESVAWAAERKDVLSGLFWMLTMFVYAGYARRPLFPFENSHLWPSVGRYLAVVAVFALGLASKSMLVTLPCVLLLLDFWPLRRWQPQQLANESGVNESSPALADIRNGNGSQARNGNVPRFPLQPLWWLVVEKLPLFGLSAAVSAKIADIQQHMGCMTMTDTVTPVYRIANAAFSAAAYLGKMIWPIDLFRSFHEGTVVCNLAVFYPHLAVMGEEAKAQLIWYGIGGAIVLAAITALVLWNLRRRPYLAVGWFWYLGTLVPVIGLIQVGAQGMADRYTYIPMIGVTIMVVWGAAELAARSREVRIGLSVAAGVALLGCTGLSIAQVATWKTSETVFQHAVDVTTDNYFAHNHLGLAIQDSVNRSHNPPSPAEQQKLDRAGHEFEEAVRLGPSYDAANANLGTYYVNRKPPQLDKGLECLKNAVRVNPHGAFHHANLGYVYMKRGEFDKAAAAFSDAIAIERESDQYRMQLAEALQRQGKTPAAVAEYYKVLRLYPQHFPAMLQLAILMSTSPDASVRDGKKALEFARQVTELSKHTHPLALHALAASYAETGDFPEAVDTAKEAIAVADMYKNQQMVDVLRQTIQGYQLGVPFREPMPPPKKNATPSS
jgi:protein O-mannosyl-transferase